MPPPDFRRVDACARTLRLVCNRSSENLSACICRALKILEWTRAYIFESIATPDGDCTRDVKWAARRREHHDMTYIAEHSEYYYDHLKTAVTHDNTQTDMWHEKKWIACKTLG